jgi:acyl-coenzyme A synthetase/AMP-(fatty) acid ligase
MIHHGWEYKEVNTMLRERAELHPKKVYIHSPDQEKQITFEETYVCCNRVANFLKHHDVKANDRIALIGENSIETLLIYLGVMNYGATICPINVEESKENAYRLLNMAKPKMVFYGKDLDFDTQKYLAERWIPYGDTDAGKGQEDDFFSTIKDYDAPFRTPLGGKDDVMIIVFTSGTTGMAKGVVHSRESFLFTPRGHVDRMNITERDIILDYRAYSWASTQGMTILPGVMVGATIVFANGFSRSRFASWVERYGATIAIGVPTVLNFLLEQPVPLHKDNVPSLRFMTSSAAPLLTKNQLEFEQKYGIPVVQASGSSETGVIGGVDPEDVLHQERRRIGSTGRAHRYADISILDDDGNRYKPGEEGEIVVKGGGTAIGYLEPDGKVALFPEGGIRTGDLGHIDEEGYIYITGRKKDVIIRGGVNIAPMEITSWLTEHPAIQEAATVGVPDKAYGEEVASFVVLKPNQTAGQDDLVNHCRKKLPDFKLPKTICFVSEIPKTGRQKVAKALLLEIWEKQFKEAAATGGERR